MNHNFESRLKSLAEKLVDRSFRLGIEPNALIVHNSIYREHTKKDLLSFQSIISLDSTRERSSRHIASAMYSTDSQCLVDTDIDNAELINKEDRKVNLFKVNEDNSYIKEAIKELIYEGNSHVEARKEQFTCLADEWRTHYTDVNRIEVAYVLIEQQDTILVRKQRSVFFDMKFTAKDYINLIQ